MQMLASLRRCSAARDSVIAAWGGKVAVCRTALYSKISGHLQEIQYLEVLSDTAANKCGRTSTTAPSMQKHIRILTSEAPALPP